MNLSPIQLTPEQKQERLMKRIKVFQEGLKKLSDDTGLILEPMLQVTEKGIIPQLVIKDKPQDNQPNQS
jgi:hypothetical protein